MSSAAGDVAAQSGFWYDFTQQRLKAWQPILAPKWVISFYLGVGVAFIGLGVLLLDLSWSVQEQSQDYTDLKTDGIVSSFELDVTKTMEPPIWVYYQLDGFHQNHRRYVKSRNDVQLRLGNDTPTSSSALGSCDPWVVDTGSRVNYPCGLVARSCFNDSFRISLKGPEDSEFAKLEVDSSATTIAWAADTNGKFKNLDPEGGDAGSPNQEKLNMWLLERFPPEECEQTVISKSKPWKPVQVAMREITTSKGKKVQVPDCKGHMTSSPKCNFVRDGKPVECSGSDYKRRAVPDWGLESGHFMVWMRIAGLPRFRKLWGKIDTRIEAGSKLLVHAADHFPVRSFHGRKTLVISTSSALGGRNDFLGWGYIVVGGVCLLFGLIYLYRHLVQPRPCGDVSSLCWQQTHTE